MDKCEFCGAPAIPMQHCLCDGAVAQVREWEAKLLARYYPKPATPEPPLWMPTKKVTLEDMKAKYPAPEPRVFRQPHRFEANEDCTSWVCVDCGYDAKSTWVSYNGDVDYGSCDPGEDATVTIPAGTLGPNDTLRIEGTATWENGKVGKVDVQIVSVEKIETSPLDRALEDFTARRKAKREASEINNASIERHGRKRGNFTFRDPRAEPLSRAMSTPLPHDPDIHTRLMPWRGKK